MITKKRYFRLLSLFLALITIFTTTATTIYAAPSDEVPEEGEVVEMTVAEEVVAIARAQIGRYESNINKFTSWYYGFDTDAYWCCIFVSWCASQAGAIETAVPRRASCDSMRTWYQSRGRYYPADSDYVPVKGDIAFLNTAGDGTDNIHHVEIVTEDGFVRRYGVNHYYAIGGNTSNLNYEGSEYVCEKLRPVTSSRANVVGYCHPNYDASEGLLGLFYTAIDLGSPDFVRFFIAKCISLLDLLEGSNNNQVPDEPAEAPAAQ